ncbi:hypothetical protein [Enterobacter roggenkampii]|uniref:hypothetical protein n=1 Tax=Enterobacter cloacae complex TaxID=354276 RepID=UPI0005EF29BE|nr:hypothetical protein [Enterobacter roggenkampii]KJP82020.1 hypothetical protein SR65_14160 [Enterobacter roggenkampii]
MDESRKAFEQYSADMLGLPLEMISDARDGDRYRHSFDRASIMQPLNGWWVLWQASREAIEIELPKKIERQPFDTDFENGFCGGHNNAIDSATIRIRSAGIKVKE